MSITKNVGINSLRAARINIEESLAKAAAVMTEDHYTIQAMRTRIAELEEDVVRISRSHTDITEEAHAQIDRVEEQDGELAGLHARVNDLVAENDILIDRVAKMSQARSQSIVESAMDAEHTNWTKHMHDRMANVTRLASGAIMHMTKLTNNMEAAGWKQDRHISAAIDLLKPLATGVHDVYEYNGATDRSSEARSSDNARDIQGFGPFGWDTTE